MLESDGRTQQAEALDGDVSKCLRKSPQSDEFITSETGVSTKQKGAGTTDVIRSNTQSIVGDQLPDYTVSYKKQEWRRQLVVKRRGAKSLKEWSRNFEHDNLAAVVQRSPSAPSSRIQSRHFLSETSQSFAGMNTSSVAIGESSQDSDQSDGSKSPLAVATRQEYVLKELMDTERDYVTGIARFIHTYGQEMKSPNLPDSLKGKYQLVFGNIEQVYAFHMNVFLPALESAKDDVLSVAKCFSSKEHELSRVYVVYCENKPRSELFLANFQGTFFDEIRQQLGDRFVLADYLIKPVQRIMKYSLLLKGLLKYSKLLGKDDEVLHLEAALKVTSEVPKQANNAVQLSMIEGYEGNIHAVGDLLLKDEFLVSDVKDGHGRQKKRHVFLLEQVVILAAVKNKWEGMMSDGFVYKDSLKIKEIGVVDSVTDDDRKFELWTGKMSKPKQKYELQAISDEMKWAWVKQIGKLLSDQLQLMRALTIFSRQKKQTVGKLISATAKALQKVDSIDESEDDLVDEEDQWDDATLPHSVELQPDPYVAAVSYTASERDASEGIISFQQGQEFQIVDQSSDLWWLVHSVNSSGTGSTVEGWVPASYLDKKEDYENMIKEQQLTNVSIEELKQGEDIQNMRNQPPSVDQGGSDSSSLDIRRYSNICRKGSFRRKTNSVLRQYRSSSVTSSNEDLAGLSFIHRFPRRARCFSGSSVTLSCMPELEDQGKEVVVRWSRNDMEIQPSSKYDITVDGAQFSLTIGYLEPSDAARYKCAVTCGDLSGSCTCTLIVNALEDDIIHEELEDYCELGNKIGIGRFSLVKSCTEKSSRVEYVAKIFKKHHNEVPGAFLAELAALSTLRHPRIVELHQAIDSSQCYALILERIRGAELFEYVVSSECLSEQVARGYVAQILDALSFMHYYDMAHLDLKPDNIMVITEEKELPRVKLIDFGSSMRISTSQQAMEAVGSPEFYAPEVIKKEAVSLASDMWSLGAVTYTLLTGLSPFYAKSIDETAINVAAMKCSYQTTPWRHLSEIAKHFVQTLLKNKPSNRLTVVQCLEHTWIKSPSISTEIIDISHLRTFIARRKWQREVTTDIVLKEQVSVL